jgi:hypothetical protein
MVFVPQQRNIIVSVINCCFCMKEPCIFITQFDPFYLPPSASSMFFDSVVGQLHVI